MRFDELLNHEGRIGAEHHHLAMRHVDDAHDAEGDRQPDRRQEQHRAERQPVPDVLRIAPEFDLPVDRGDAALGPGLQRRVLGAAGEGGKQRARVPVAPRRDDVDRFRLLGGGPVGFEDGGRTRLLEAGLHLRHAFRRDRLVERRDLLRIGAVEQRVGGGEPPGGILRPQRQRAERVAHGDADRILDLDLLQRPVGRGAGRLARQRIGERVGAVAVACDEHRPVALAVVKVTLRKRLQRRRHGRVAGGGELFDERLDVGEAFGLAELLDELPGRLVLRARGRRGGAAAEDEQEEQSGKMCLKGSDHVPLPFDGKMMRSGAARRPAIRVEGSPRPIWTPSAFPRHRRTCPS